MTATREPIARLRAWAPRQGDEYRNGSEHPLGGYVALMAGYASGTLAAARGLGRSATRA
jgi:hypothetical protein